MEQLVQTFLEAIFAVVFLVGKELIVPKTRMTVLLNQAGALHVYMMALV